MTFTNFKKSFAKKGFLIMAFGIMTPIFGMFLYINRSFSSYMDKEISSKVSEIVDGSEQRIYTELENLVNISNVFFSNEEFQRVMDSEEISYYDKCLYFDSMVGDMENSNILDSQYVKLTYFDAGKNLYTNWNVNFNKYDFLWDKWIGSYQGKRGYLTWRFFEDSLIREEQGKNKSYISLIRFWGGGKNGVMIISMDIEYLNQLLKEYCFSENDHIFIYTPQRNRNLNDSLMEAADLKIRNSQEKGSAISDTFMTKIQNNKYIFHYYGIKNYLQYGQEDFKVIALIDYQNVVEQTTHYLIRNWLFLMAFANLLLLIIYTIVKIVLRPINHISEKMVRYQVGEVFEYKYNREDEIGHMYQAFEGMTKRTNELFHRLNEEHAVREKYRYESLRAQINPHFIFNTLNSIRWMAMIRKENNIVESIDALAEILHYSMGKGEDTVTLRQELDSVKAYVEIQNLRYGGNCSLIDEIPPEFYSCQMIKFSMQPIVENCFIHAFKDNGKSEWIRISACQEEGRLILEIANSGIPVSDEAIRIFEDRKQSEHRDQRKVTGIGMHHVDEIIKITYGSEFGLQMTKRENKTVVQYVLPFIPENRAGGEM